MTLNQVPFVDRALGSIVTALLLFAAPVTAALFLAQSL